jgi:hypothetical protein
MFRHVVMFRWKDDADPDQIGAALDGLLALPDLIPGVRSFTVGADAGLGPANHDVVVVVEFDDQAAYETYAEHPAHVALVTDHLRPLIADRAAVQHPLD